MSSSDQNQTEDESTPTDNEFSVIIDAGKLGDALDAAAALVDECKLKYDSSGIGITAVDAANVGMIDVTIPETACESFQASSGVLGINLSDMSDVIGLANSGDLAVLELNPDTNKLKVTVDGLEYTLALIDPDALRQEPDIPDLGLPATITLEGKQLSRGLKASDMVSDHVAIRVPPHVPDPRATIEATGDTDTVEYTLFEEDVISLDGGEEPADSFFSLDYFNSITSPLPNSAEATLRLGEEAPAKLEYNLGDGDISVLYMIAPRIQS